MCLESMKRNTPDSDPGKEVEFPHQDALVIFAIIKTKLVKQLMIDRGSSVNLLSLSDLHALGGITSDLKPLNTSVLGLGGTPLIVEGKVDLELEIGADLQQLRQKEMTKAEPTLKVTTSFAIVNMSIVYNGILGRPALSDIGAMICIRYLLLKIPTPEGTITIKGDQYFSRNCFLTTMTHAVVALDLEVPDLNDIEGVDLSIVSECLYVDKDSKPMKQNERIFSIEKQIATRVEIDKLIKAGFIRKVHYLEWLINVVLIKKANGKWRPCIDFTDLNYACPKDSFPLPNIDQLVDATCGFLVYDFLDASQGYHQIQMNKDDDKKTKNVGVYVDDIVVKLLRIEDHIRDLEETFEKSDIGKFLGHLISEKGMWKNLEKIEAVVNMKVPRSVMEQSPNKACNPMSKDRKICPSPEFGRRKAKEIL
ncbi:uncharacterized protein LOC126672623 [Mercurialis annua]|uniref:uncharacterized protein LOC126672623 n=1 Tax=Mercurialis annua TaxID=3986 RepID=UPI002160DA09|nr:uncharacterized protein LOC126672623 [Mercurialis annua]